MEDGWLRADRTTLGADNGLGCAAAWPDDGHQCGPSAPAAAVHDDEETGLGSLSLLIPG